MDTGRTEHTVPEGKVASGHGDGVHLVCRKSALGDVQDRAFGINGMAIDPIAPSRIDGRVRIVIGVVPIILIECHIDEGCGTGEEMNAITADVVEAGLGDLEIDGFQIEGMGGHVPEISAGDGQVRLESPDR